MLQEYGSSSDEEADKSSETWEHKRRAREMLKTAEKALEVTKANVGKHFIGDFLPKDEVIFTATTNRVVAPAIWRRFSLLQLTVDFRFDFAGSSPRCCFIVIFAA